MRTAYQTYHPWLLLLCIVVFFAIGLGVWNSAAADQHILKIPAARDMYKDATGTHDYRPWSILGVDYYSMYVGMRSSPYKESTTAFGFDLSDTHLEDYDILSIKLSLWRDECSGRIDISVYDTKDDDWQDNYDHFPDMVDSSFLYTQAWGIYGFAQSPDIRDAILQDYLAGDEYLTLVMSSTSTTYYAGIYTMETSGKVPYLEVIYVVPVAVITTAQELSENSINGIELSLELVDAEFNTAELTPEAFSLNSEAAAAGYTVSDAAYVDSTHARLTLAGSGDKDEHIGLSVTIDGSVLLSNEALTTNVMKIHAYDEITRGGTYDLSALGLQPEIHVYTAEPVTFIQTSALSIENCTISNMISGVDLEIAGVNIDNNVGGGGAGLDFMGTGNTLLLTGANTIYTQNRSALHVPAGAELTIQGTGSLEATSQANAAAIGAETGEQLGDIVINSGTVQATCAVENGAGIGVSDVTGAAVGTVTINGGSITAIGGKDSAGIGTGKVGSCDAIVINGGTLVVRGGNSSGAGIGTGDSGTVNTITIAGGNITAGYTGGGIGIGAGYKGKIGTIAISGGTIDARWGGESDAAIGCDSYGVVDHIHISGGLIFANGYSLYADDIGLGKVLATNAVIDVQISGAAVVFLRNNKLADRNDGIAVPFYDTDTITDHQAYGFTLPSDWSGTAYAYIAAAIPVTGIFNTQKELRLNVTTVQTAQLTAETIPSYADHKGLLYTSGNPAVATVDANGLVTPVSQGTAEITITTVEGGYSDKCNVTVYKGLTALGVTPSQPILYLGGDEGTESVALTPLFTPADASDQAVTYYSYNTGVATVNASGVVTAVGAGNTWIVVTSNDGGLEAYCSVTVRQITTGITLSPAASVLVLGDQNTVNDTVSISAVVSPSNAYDKTIVWESTNPSVAAVDQNGLVTALHSGNTTIKATAQDGGGYAEASVVVEQKVTGITISPTEAVLLLGSGNLSDGSITFSYTVSPSDAKDQSAQFTSSDPSVVSITGNRATAWKAGEATITVTSNDGAFTAKCLVQVRQLVTGISLNETEAALYLDDGNVSNDTLQLTATVAPDTAADKTVTWESSVPDVATVDDTGLVTAHKGGETIITATSSNINWKATCKITVNQSVQSVELVPETATLVLGDSDTDNDTLQLITTIAPKDATDPSYTYHSSDPAVAIVDSSGLVTALKKGTTTITAASSDGIHQATCAVTVEQQLMLHGSAHSGKVCLGGCITITPSLGGGTWAYDPSAVSLQGNTFTPLRPGTTVVTYTLDSKGKGKSILRTLLGLFLSSASADNVEEASFTITTEALTLTSSLTDGNARLAESFTLTPNFAGGVWNYDGEYLTRIGDAFYPRKEGTVTITYTYNGQTATYQAMIYDYPNTGDGRPSVLLYGAGLVLSGALIVLLLLRKRAARGQ